MSSSLRIPEEMLAAWVRTLAPLTDVRGAPAVAKEMEAHLAKASDGYVTVGRHQLFTWGETLAGAARRTPLGSSVQAVSEEIRAVLAGKDAAPAASASRPAPSPSSPDWRPPPPPPVAAAPVPAVTYARSGTPAAQSGAQSGGSGAVRLVAEHDAANVVSNLLREARREILVVSPWVLGLETLAAELARTPPSVRLRIVSRRPEKEDESYHRAMRDLQRRGVEIVMSPFLHTRMIVADGEVLLLGAAGLPKPGTNLSREVALLTSDAAAVDAARRHFDRVMAEARGEAPR